MAQQGQALALAWSDHMSYQICAAINTDVFINFILFDHIGMDGKYVIEEDQHQLQDEANVNEMPFHAIP